jgi:hypothetical protein
MALIGGAALFVGSILAAALSRILAEEMAAWIPSIVRVLIKLAVARLPENQRARYQEEWQSHLSEVPGTVGKLIEATGFLQAAHKMSLAKRRNPDFFEARLQMIAQIRDSHSKVVKMVNAILGDQRLACDEQLKSLTDRVNSLLAQSEERVNQWEAEVSAFPTTLTADLLGRTLCRRRTRRAQKLLDTMSVMLKEANHATDQIMEVLEASRNK